MMTGRLIELHRVLKATGSMYLHCDPTSGPYLRMILDAVFEPKNFVNEIVWKRSTSPHNDPKRFGRNHDTILFFQKGPGRTWNPQYGLLDPAYVEETFRYADSDGRRYRLNELTANKPGGDVEYEWKGRKPPVGRYWAYSRANMEKFDAQGKIVYSKTGFPRVKQYLLESPGTPYQTIWDDVLMEPKERLGYKTQKPRSLLARIISASSHPGDVILDPFCGCGTALHAAQTLGRQWIGIDITHLAIGLIRRRMQDAFPGIQIEVIGEPVDLTGAQDLAQRDKYQFQWWALDKLGAQPVAGKRKGSDKGIDGVIPFFAGNAPGQSEYARAIVSVKGGEHAGVGSIRDLKGVLDREKEPIGILLTLNPPTKDMTTEAAASGFYENDFWKKKYPRVQIMTVLEVLKGKRPDMPWGGSPFAKAPVEKEQADQESML